VKEFPPFRLDTVNRCLWRGYERVPLTPKGFSVLQYLVERAGCLVSQRELLDALWPGIFVQPEVLKSHILDIRGALGDNARNPAFVETQPRRGYRFLAEVSDVADWNPNRGRGARNPVDRPESVGLAPPNRIAAADWVASSGAPAAMKPIDALAVLPFSNARGDPETDYLSEGISESIINHLSQIAAIRVVPRNSAFRYKGRETDQAAIRRELGVGAIVTGRVVQSGESLTVSAELVDITLHRQLWGERYHRKLSEIFAVQEDIATQISDKLRLRLTRTQKEQLLRRYTSNGEAYHLYLKGRYQWSRRTPQSLNLAVDCFQQAIQEDPFYALAYAGLADGYNLLGWYGFFTPQESLQRSQTSAVKALQIDPELAEAHAALGFAKACGCDWAGGEAALRRALQINPNYWLGYDWRALCLAGMGRAEEAITAIWRAQQIDPLSLLIFHHAAWVHIQARRHSEAIEQCRRALELEPNYPWAHLWLGLACTETGVHAEALTALERAVEILGKVPFAEAALAHALARAGRHSEAAHCLDRLANVDQLYVDPYHLSLIYTGLGRLDQAIECLEKSYRDGSMWLAMWAKLDPRIDPLRGDRRFDDVLRHLGG
jgi:TolB-like protein/DNA-binding winged helix-turn-helix (wHTH) protein/Flp pilus assembly protein TadD